MCKRVVIVAGGHIESYELDLIEDKDIIITADAGVIPLLQKGIRPHQAVGDFDTIDACLLIEMAQKGIAIQKLPLHKDETDTHHAVRVAMEYSPQEIMILGALGGSRFDYMLGNIGLLEWLVDKEVPAVLIHASNRMRLLKGPTSWDVLKSVFSYISLLPITSHVTGVTTKGFVYSLDNATLSRGLTQGISNELIEESGTVFIEEGKCLVIESMDF